MSIANKKNRHLNKAEKLEIVMAYQNLVRKIASKYARRCADPVEDLTQVGLIALLEAAENFKELYNTQFKTYAIHFISGHIRHYLRDKQSLFKGPRSLQELSYKLNQTTRTLTQELDREPTINELADTLNLTVNKINEIRAYEKKISVIWLDQLLRNDNEDDNKSMLDTIFDPKSSNDIIEEKITLRDAINKLAPSERQLLELRYFNDMTQVEISNIFGISQMEVCRKLKRAEKELKTIMTV